MKQPHWLEHRQSLPRVRRYRHPLLLLHGAWHGAWCWQEAMEDFAARGFEVHNISLRGHGASDSPRLHQLCRLDDYVCDLATAIQQIHPAPIVVGHSLGGFVLQHYLMQQRLPGAVLLCSVPPSGTGRFLWHWMRRHPRATLHTLLTLNNRHLVGTAQLARAAFFPPELPADELARYTALLVGEPNLVALDSILRLPQPQRNRTPLLVLSAEADAVFTLEEQQALAEAYNAPWVRIPAASHDLMLDPAWPRAAEAIERAARAFDSG